MAVNRSFNFLGQQRVDVPHLRMIESAVCYDFDVLGLMVTASIPCVVNGFEVLNYTNIINSLASQLTIKVASSRLIHPLASDSGSFFQVPSNRANEVLDSSNGKILGSWTPGVVNYLGVDLVKKADSTTATNVRFLTTNPNTETNKTVPLARTMNYMFTISTTPFSTTSSILPLYVVTLDSTGKVTAIKDARNLLFSNSLGGDSPTTINPYGWPGSRNESTYINPLIGGDRSIKSLKQWLNAAMSRFQELGGGEYWYSLTADRNVRMAQSDTFTSNGESFEWDGTNLHWKGIKFLFDNSTSYINEVADQTTDLAGLTNLLDGECLYVDLDRTTNHTVSGTNALVAKKAPLAVLGGSATPGQRWTIASRIGNKIYVRDQSYPVGSAFKLATTTVAGVLRTSINANGTITDPIAVGLAYSANANYSATCGGISHNADLGVNTLLGTGDIIIGRGSSAGDGGIFIQSNTEGKPIILYGSTSYSISNLPAVKIIQNKSNKADLIATFGYVGGDHPLPSIDDQSIAITSIGVDGSIGMITAELVPPPPVSNFSQNKVFFRKNKTYYGQVDAIFNLYQNAWVGWDWDANAKTWTRQNQIALISDDFYGVTPTVGMKVVAYATTYYQVAQAHAGFFTITALGGSGNHAVLTLYEPYPLFEGVTVYNNASVGSWHNTYIKIDTPDPIIYYNTPIRFTPTTNKCNTQQCSMWQGGAVTAISESITSETLV